MRTKYGIDTPQFAHAARAGRRAEETAFSGKIAAGPFTPDWRSFRQYECPEWFRDAKFGIWAHWSPQCQPEQGDWYAFHMYKQDSRYYQYHVEHYGHPSKFGYKDICNLWKAEKWDPEKLISSTSGRGPSTSWRWPITTAISTAGIRNTSPGTPSISARRKTLSASGRKPRGGTGCGSA